MFTGIIEELGVIKKITQDRTNLIIKIEASFIKEIQVKQSVAHNGICLTITEILKNNYSVCLIDETINKTNMSSAKEGDLINLERCLTIGGRLDGHFVQGHVDCQIQCKNIRNNNGSWIFQFMFPKDKGCYLIPKGSITLNGVSLTISSIQDENQLFEVSIIPYTFQNTTFHNLKKGDYVNVEFDLISKQLVRLNQLK
tara:strand:- start:114 stop:707 length:594 start_codon:yes stop_codon:yes gene_type:complete